jgi:hypothetical protein
VFRPAPIEREMFRRTSILCLEVIIGILAVVGILLVGTAWRISQGPVSLKFLLPYADRVLNDEAGQVRVQVEDVFLTWAGWERALDLRAEGLDFRAPDGGRLARIREVSLSLSFRALLEGAIAPTSLEIIRPRILLVRAEAGDIRLGFGALSEQGTEASDAPQENALRPLIDSLSGPARPDSPFRFLNRIRVLDGALRVNDRKMNVTWGARHADISLTRRPDGLLAVADLEPSLPGEPQLNASVQFLKDQGRIEARLNFSGINPSLVAGSFPELAAAKAANVPLRGTLTATADTEGNLLAGAFGLTAGKGTVAIEGSSLKPIAIGGAEFAGNISRAPDQITLSSGRVRLADGSAALTATLTRAGPLASVVASLNVDSLKVDSLGKYWPENAVADGRNWVLANIRGGEVRNAVANVTAHIDLEGERAGAFEVDSLGGRFSVGGATIRYLAPLPPITEAEATATFSTRRFDFAVRSGRVGTLELSDGAVNIWDIGAPKEWLSVTTVIRGPVRDALELLAHPRLDLLSNVGLTPEGTAGSQSTRLKVTLPLIDKLAGADVAVVSTSRIEGLTLPNVVAGEGIDDGTAMLTVDNAALKAEGAAQYLGTPVRFIWNEYFGQAPEVRRELSLGLVLDAKLRNKFGIEFPDILNGPVPARIAVRDGLDGNRSLAASMNLEGASLTIPGFNWIKPGGVASTAEVSASFRDDKLVKLDAVKIDSEGFSAAGSAEFSPDGETLASLQVDRFRLGENSFSLKAARSPAAGWEIDAGGDAFDARPFIAKLTETGAPPPLPAFRLDARFDKIRINDGPQATNGGIGLRRDDKRWRDIRINVQMPGTTKVTTFKMESGSAGDAMSLYTPDAGNFIRSLHISDAIAGGELEARAIRPGPETPWNGAAEMTAFRIASAPTFARILTLSSLTGIGDVVSGKQGITFDRMIVPFKFGDGLATIVDMRAVGSELGITAEGTVDLEKDVIKIRGTIVPAYTINSLLGKIPLVGTLLTGDKGGGIFAASYEVTGPVVDPKTSVNPLSALAPAFLRNLLGGASSSASSPDPSPVPPPSE